MSDVTRTEPKTATEGAAAAYLGYSPMTLKAGRRGIGACADLPFIRTGRTIRYLIADLDAWLTRHRIGGTRG